MAALENGKRGERYILGGENLTLKQILDRLASITGLSSPTVKVPQFVALGAARGRRAMDRSHSWERTSCNG